MAKKKPTRRKRRVLRNPKSPAAPKRPDEIASSQSENGLECPACGCRHLPVLYTRRHVKRIKRVRQCRNCGRRVISYERIPDLPVRGTQTGGAKEPYVPRG